LSSFSVEPTLFRRTHVPPTQHPHTMKKSFHTFVSIFAALMAAALAAGSASAAIVYGNLGPDGSGALSTTTGPSLNFPAGTRERAIGFIPIGPNLSLQSAVLNLQNNSGNDATARVDLYTDVSGNPGTSLFSTTLTINANTAGLVTFPINQTLTAGTPYWLVATKDGPDATNNLFWRAPSPNTAATEQNGSGWSSTATSGKITDDSGNTWTNASTINVGFNLVAVPEPSTWVLAGMGLVAAGFVRWIRTSRGG